MSREEYQMVLDDVERASTELQATEMNLSALEETGGDENDVNRARDEKQIAEMNLSSLEAERVDLHAKAWEEAIDEDRHRDANATDGVNPK